MSKKASMKVGNGKIPLNNGTKKTAKRRNAHNASLIHRTAEITGKGEDYVRKVVAGDRNSKEVELVYGELREGNNKLIEAVKTLVPFTGYQDIELQVGYKKFN